MGAGQHHRALIKPDAFHVNVLFQPTLAFLERIADVLPSGGETARSANSILDEFVLKVYLPQLEDKVDSLFHQTVHGKIVDVSPFSSFSQCFFCRVGGFPE